MAGLVSDWISFYICLQSQYLQAWDDVKAAEKYFSGIICESFHLEMITLKIFPRNDIIRFVCLELQSMKLHLHRALCV